MVRSALKGEYPQLRRLRLLAHGDSWLLAERGSGITLADFEFAEVHQGSGRFSRSLNARQNTSLAHYAFGVRNPLPVVWPTIRSRRPGMQPPRRPTPSETGAAGRPPWAGSPRTGQEALVPADRAALPPDRRRAPDGGALRLRLLPRRDGEAAGRSGASPSSAGTRSRQRNGPACAFRSGTGTAVHNLGLRSAAARGTGPGS
jgi:hypothetical protein